MIVVVQYFLGISIWDVMWRNRYWKGINVNDFNLPEMLKIISRGISAITDDFYVCKAIDGKGIFFKIPGCAGTADIYDIEHFFSGRKPASRKTWRQSAAVNEDEKVDIATILDGIGKRYVR